LLANDEDISAVSEEESQADDDIESIKGEIEQTEAPLETETPRIEEAANLPTETTPIAPFAAP